MFDPRRVILATITAAAIIFGADGAAVADPIAAIAGIQCEVQIAGKTGDGVCADRAGNVAAHTITVRATKAELAQCVVVIVNDSRGRPAACASVDDGLVLAGNVFPRVSRAKLDAVGTDGVCVGDPTTPARELAPPVACFTRGGDLLLAGDVNGDRGPR
jgi:hypothetical protein